VLSVFDVVLILVIGGLKLMLSICFVAACIRGRISLREWPLCSNLWMNEDVICM
jgi:hypothetical protein